jgi:hypothetical protein
MRDPRGVFREFGDAGDPVSFQSEDHDPVGVVLPDRLLVASAAELNGPASLPTIRAGGAPPPVGR